MTEGTRVALPIRWQGCPSGCVEWKLVDWATKDDGKKIPVLDDDGETTVWWSDYALRGPDDNDWRFPDGERCGDKALVAAFTRRAGTSLVEYKPNRAERRALARQHRQVASFEKILEALEARGEVRSVIGADGERRWIAVPDRLH